MKALVTGATGFIGSHLVEKLVEKGYAVTCLVRKTSDLRWIEGVRADIIYGDCENSSSLLDIPSDIDYVFHAAGLTKAKREQDFFRANVIGTENLIETVLSRIRNLKRFVYLSSLAATGPGIDQTPVSECSETKPVSSYGKSKLQGENAVLAYRNKIPVSIIRPPAVYGPRDKDFYVLFRMLKKGFYPYYGKCYYSLLYVDDLVRGLITAAEAETAAGEIYFLSDGKIYSNNDIVFEMLAALNTKATRIIIPGFMMSFFVRAAEKLGNRLSILNKDKLKELKCSYWICDSAKAGKELGFIPKVTIKEGMQWTTDWYRIHQWL